MKGTVNQFVGGAFGLIALFLILEHFSGFGADITAGAAGGTKLITALQGR